MFVGKLIDAAINNNEEGVKNFSPKKDYKFTNRALKELTSVDGLKTALDAREWLGEWDELYYAFGGAKYILHASDTAITSQEEYGEKVVLEKGIDIEASDRYYWQLNFPIGFHYKKMLVNSRGMLQ